MRGHLCLSRPHEHLAVDFIPNRLLLRLILIDLVVMRDTPIFLDARVVEVPTTMVHRRGVLEDLVRQDVKLSRLKVVLTSKGREVMLGLAINEVEGRFHQVRIIFMLTSPFLVVMVILGI